MPRSLKTVEISLQIINMLKELDGATMNEISDRLELANSTVYGHLKTLESNRFVVKEANEYHLGIQFFDYGMFTKRRKPEYLLAEPHVRHLTSMTNEDANFCVGEHGKIVILYGDRSGVDPAWGVGHSYKMHNTAVGKAILAEMTDQEVLKIVDRWGMPQTTDKTITNEEALFDELDKIRERGYSINDEELMPGLSSVGAVVTRPDSTVIGGLGVGGATYRVKGERLNEELPQALLQTRQAFEEEIQSMYTPD